jgi:hypothetical protein
MLQKVQRKRSTSQPERRYKVKASIEYKILGDHRTAASGNGTTVSFSSSRIVFKPESPIPAGLQIEAYVDWPACRESGIASKLHVHAETVGTRHGCAVVKILRYEFQVLKRR